MTIQLEKTIKSDGSIWFYVMQDMTCIAALELNEKNTDAEERARAIYSNAIQSAKKGLPITEILASEII